MNWVTEAIDIGLNWLDIHKAGLGVLATIAATFAALVSAWNARSTRISAKATTHQSEVSLTAVQAKSIQIEYEKIRRLGNELYLSYLSLATFAGGVGGSRQEMYEKAAKEKVIHAEAISKTAIAYLKDLEALDRLKSKELSKARMALSLVYTELVDLSGSMIDELTEIRSQIRLYQEKVVKG